LPSPSSPNREWITGDPFEDGLEDLGMAPKWVLEMLSMHREKRKPGLSDGGESGCVMPLDDRQVAQIKAALQHIDSDPRDTWIRVGMALKSTGARQQAFDIWCNWSQSSPKYNSKTQASQWNAIREFRFDGSEITIASVFFWAKEAGWSPSIEDELDADSIESDETGLVFEVPATPMSGRAAPPSAVLPFDRDLLDYAPGFVGRLGRWVESRSIRPQPATCLAAALTAVGALLGRRIASPTDLRTNLYTLGIGETGCGKEASLKMPELLFRRAQIDQFVGDGRWKSDSGLRSALMQKPSQFCPMDEFVKQLMNMAGDRVPPHLAGIKDHVLSLFGCASGVHHASAYADREKNAPVVLNEPNLCIYGTGVPADLFKAMDGGAVADGFLNRFLVFFVDDPLPPIQYVPRETRYDEMIADVQQLEECSRPDGDLTGITSDQTVDTGCVTLRFTSEAQTAVDEIQQANDDRIREMRAANNPMADLWNRFTEHVIKIALVAAGSEWVPDNVPKVTVSHVRWAERLAMWCLGRTQAAAERYVADSQVEAKVKRVLRILEEAGEDGMTASQLTRKTYWLSRFERKDVIATLADGGQIIAHSVPTKRRPVTTYWASQFVPQSVADAIEAAEGGTTSTNSTTSNDGTEVIGDDKSQDRSDLGPDGE